MKSIFNSKSVKSVYKKVNQKETFVMKSLTMDDLAIVITNIGHTYIEGNIADSLRDAGLNDPHFILGEDRSGMIYFPIDFTDRMIEGQKVTQCSVGNGQDYVLGHIVNRNKIDDTLSVELLVNDGKLSYDICRKEVNSNGICVNLYIESSSGMLKIIEKVGVGFNNIIIQ